nr:MAG TPA: hypothetical protein [Caudoviricetes sp.]
MFNNNLESIHNKDINSYLELRFYFLACFYNRLTLLLNCYMRIK